MEWLEADWPAPPWVRAISTTRRGGISLGPYAGLNLGDHVGDDATCVAANRERLRLGAGPARRAPLVAPGPWLRGGAAHEPGGGLRGGCHGGLGSGPGLRRPDGRLPADPALRPRWHPGRRGPCRLARPGRGRDRGGPGPSRGRLPSPCWPGWAPLSGPGPSRWGPRCGTCFLAWDGQAAAAFVPLGQGQWLADLPLLARHRLARLGVRDVRGAGLCTFQDAGRFYSYRRDGATGRMASLIWIEPHHA